MAGFQAPITGRFWAPTDTQASKMDNCAYWAMVQAICLKHDISRKKMHKGFYFNGRVGVSPERRLARFSDTKRHRDYRRPKEYTPGKSHYLDEEHWEADLRSPECGRPGTMDLKLQVLKRDENRCCNCGCLVLAETSHLDHKKPVNRFASFEQASTLDNLQTLCLYCHTQKSRSDQMKKV